MFQKIFLIAEWKKIDTNYNSTNLASAITVKATSPMTKVWTNDNSSQEEEPF